MKDLDENEKKVLGKLEEMKNPTALRITLSTDLRHKDTLRAAKSLIKKKKAKMNKAEDGRITYTKVD